MILLKILYPYTLGPNQFMLVTRVYRLCQVKIDYYQTKNYSKKFSYDQKDTLSLKYRFIRTLPVWIIRISYINLHYCVIYYICSINYNQKPANIVNRIHYVTVYSNQSIGIIIFHFMQIINNLIFKTIFCSLE